MTREEKRQSSKSYYESHKDSERLRKRKYYSENRDAIISKSKRLELSQKWYSKNRTRKLEYQYNYEKERLKTDINFKLKHYLRSRLYIALKRNHKNGSAVKDLGCSMEVFKSHIESQFKDGMTWENHGNNGWHLDHIIPLASFDLTNRNELLSAVHYSNYQPLWAKDNLSKKDRVTGK